MSSTSHLLSDLFTHAQTLQHKLMDANPLLAPQAAETLTNHLKETMARELDFTQQTMATAQERLSELVTSALTAQAGAESAAGGLAAAQRALLEGVGSAAVELTEAVLQHAREGAEAHIAVAKTLSPHPVELAQRAQEAAMEAGWGALTALMGMQPAPEGAEEGGAAEEGGGARASS